VELVAVENVNGALVGGARLVAADFLAIAGAYLAWCNRLADL
jgi:triosephosphate isomerase